MEFDPIAVMLALFVTLGVVLPAPADWRSQPRSSRS